MPGRLYTPLLGFAYNHQYYNMHNYKGY